MFRLFPCVLMSVAFVLVGCSHTAEKAPATTATNSASTAASDPLPQFNLADGRYLTQLDKVKASPDIEGYQQLRGLFVKTSIYGPSQAFEQNVAAGLFQAIDQQRWGDCLQTARTLLKASYISLNGHFAAMVCAEKLGEQAMADQHKHQLDLLIEAIWRSGDGKTPASAFFCTSTAELYAFIRLHGLEAIGQSFVTEGGKSLNKMQLKDSSSQNTVTWYFDISSQVVAGY